MIISEVPFNVFLQRNPHLKDRPLNEQIYHYNDYIMVITMQQHIAAGKSDTIEPEPEETFFLLQENGDFLLQENNDKILL